jgi:hypothetical protein
MVVLPLEKPWSFKEMGYQNFGSLTNCAVISIVLSKTIKGFPDCHLQWVTKKVD